MKWMRERLSRDEGFTLIELMVVVLIIAILIAIAIPSFIGFRKNAQDRSVQSDLRSGLLAEKGYWTENSQVFSDDLATLQAEFEPNLNGAMDVSTSGAANDHDAACLELESDSGKFFAMYETANGTMYGEHTATMVAACPAAPATLVAPTGAPGTWTAGGW